VLGVEEVIDGTDLQAMRTEAIRVMRSLSEDSRPSVQAQWKLLAARKDDPGQLANLITRAQNTQGAAAS
jgi:hypothetical protein